MRFNHSYVMPAANAWNLATRLDVDAVKRREIYRKLRYGQYIHGPFHFGFGSWFNKIQRYSLQNVDG